MSPHTRVRDTRTGRIRSAIAAKLDPAGTVVEDTGNEVRLRRLTRLADELVIGHDELITPPVFGHDRDDPVTTVRLIDLENLRRELRTGTA